MHLDGLSGMNQRRDAVMEQRAKVTGFIRPTARVQEPKVDPASFKPSPFEKISAGMKILHLRFGEGDVKAIEGGKDNPIAAIHFKDLNETKKIALKFAKLQILE